MAPVPTYLLPPPACGGGRGCRTGGPFGWSIASRRCETSGRGCGSEMARLVGGGVVDVLTYSPARKKALRDEV
jgi:hypothetical protein